jgi:hypothetical protein
MEVIVFKYTKSKSIDGPGPYFVWTIDEDGDAEWHPMAIFDKDYQPEEGQEWFVKIPRPNPMDSVFKHVTIYPAFSNAWYKNAVDSKGNFTYAKVTDPMDLAKLRRKEHKGWPHFYWRHECPGMGDPGWHPLHLNMVGDVNWEWDYFLAIPTPPDPCLLEEANDQH